MNMQRHASFRSHRETGFTLIELMIAVVVVGVLLAVALPSFMDSIRKSRRSDAYAAVAAVQQAQERWRSNKPNYTTTWSELGLSSGTTNTAYYELSLDAPPSGSTLATGYIVNAVGKDGTSQANDSECRKLSVKVVAGSITYAGCGSCSSFTYATSNACWKR